MNKRRLGILVLLCMLLVGVFQAWAAPAFEAVWSRLASGGGERAASHYEVQDILGQWLSSSPAGTNAQVVTDFFWAGDTGQQVYLPLVVRGP
jgi:hypothetical protein